MPPLATELLFFSAEVALSRTLQTYRLKNTSEHLFQRLAKILLERWDNLEMGGIDVEMRGLSLFLLLCSSIAFTLRVEKSKVFFITF